MFGLGGQEILLLLVLGVLLFGRKLPDIGRSIGKTMVEFKKGDEGHRGRGERDESARGGDRAGTGQAPATGDPGAPKPKFDDAPAAPTRAAEGVRSRSAARTLTPRGRRLSQRKRPAATRAERAINSVARVRSSHGRSHRFKSCIAH